jgi:hypothetical protein
MSNSQQAVNPTDFFIEKLEIIGKYPNGSDFSYDVSSIFEELSIFDNMFVSCMSGNIVIRDGLGMIDSLSLDGNEFIHIKIKKVNAEEEIEELSFDKRFRIHKVQNRTNVSATAQIYTLHFTSEEHLLSENTKEQKYYKGTYSSIAEKILNTLNGPKIYKPYWVESLGIHHIVIPNLTPFQGIDWIARRAIWQNKKPDFVFFEIKHGYCFASLSRLFDYPTSYKINFFWKDMKGNKLGTELFGARDLKIVSQFTVLESLMSGVYGGTFVGFDTLTRTYKENVFTFSNLYQLGKEHHANPYPNIPLTKKLPEIKNDMLPTEEFKKSRVTTYPFSYPRTTQEGEYVKEFNPELALMDDNTHEYVFQRKHFFGNLAMKRLQLTMPGNFALYTGIMVELDVPKYTGANYENDVSVDSRDIEFSGRYIITGVRHTIKYDRHETLIEVASDSSIKQK